LRISNASSNDNPKRLIIKDGVFKDGRLYLRDFGSSLSLINVSMTGSYVSISNGNDLVFINVNIPALDNEASFGSYSTIIYNSRISGNSSVEYSTSTSYPHITVTARKSHIGGAAAGASYTGSYWSTEKDPASSNGYGLAKQIFPGFLIQTDKYDGSQKVTLDMSDFVTTEHDQGDDQYYPVDARAFDNTYHGGALSDEVVNALQKDWDKDLAGNPRIRGDRIDVGPYETQE
jgi:hypothetical protein